MKYKKIMLILITAIFLVSIAGVCAADANDTIVTSEDNLEIDQTDDAIGVGADTNQASSEENEILTEGEQTFSQLNMTINGNTDKDIYLNGNYKYSSGDDSFKNGIIIDRDMNIYGNGHTINGSGEARIFQVNGGNVVFYNITFVKGNAGDQLGNNSGAINGKCTAINCTFKQNQAYNGGAMYHGSAVNCSFTGNTARYGGAMYGSAVNCSFINNSASSGGAIYGGSAVNCSFSNNTAKYNGGAIFRGSAVNCTFSRNTAAYGGAMYYGYKLNCIGENDYCQTGDLVLQWDANDFTTTYGSAEKLPIRLSIDFINYDVVIYKDGREVNTYHCLSNDFLAIDLLPGVYTAELTVTYPGITQPEPINITLTVTDGTTFWDLNKAINDNANDTITLDRDYAFNSTTDSAFIGGIEINRPVTINGNGHTIDAKGQAAILWVIGDNVTINNVTFVNGRNNYGGAICWVGANGAVSGSSFTGNTAAGGVGGGAICWVGDNGAVSGSSFTGNTAEWDGGAIYWTGINGNVSNSIFINNTANREGDAIYGNKYLIADYCWFGGNATNYLDLPIPQNVHCDYILFLNATANPAEVPAFSTSEIVFKLYLHNNNGNISEYDNTLLLPINLTITSTNGDVDIHTVNLGDSIRYTATGVGDASVTATIENVACTIALNNIMANPNLSVENQVVTYGENATIALNYNPNATGKVNITLTGKKGTLTYQDIDLNATIMLSNVVPADEYDVNVTYSGDNVFLNATATGTLTVHKASTEINVNPASLDLFVGDETVIVANLTPADAGNVTFTSSNVSVVEFDDQGIVIAQGKGQAIIIVSFAGNNNYAAAENRTVTVTVNLDEASVAVDKNTLDLKVGETYAINATKHPDTILLDITYTSSNSSVATVDEKGIVTAVGVGSAVITVEVGDDEIYAKNSTTVKVTVSKVPTEIATDPIAATYNANKDLVITLKDSNGNPIGGLNITVDLNGTKNYTTDTNGQVRIPTKGLAANIYDVLISFNGTDNYLNCSNTTTVSIYKESSRVDTKPLTTDYNVHKYLVVGLKDKEGNPIRNADAYIEIHGVTYKCRSDDAGDARLIIRLNPGTYTAKITFDNVNYTGFTQYVTVIVKKATPKLTAKKKTFKKSKKVKKYTVTLKDNNGKAMAKVKLTLKVKGKTYKAKTNSKGKATFKIKNLKKKGTFKAKVKFVGNAYYNAVTKTVKIKIK